MSTLKLAALAGFLFARRVPFRLQGPELCGTSPLRDIRRRQMASSLFDMRQEFYRYYLGPISAVWLEFIFISNAYGAWRQSRDYVAASAHDTLCSAFCEVIHHPLFHFMYFTGFAMYVAVVQWRRKRSMTQPLIIVDDAGLWLREVGELMPWSEIQSVELAKAWPPRFTVVCRRVPIRVAGTFMDRHGKTPWDQRWVYNVVRERWERNCAVSGVQEWSQAQHVDVARSRKLTLLFLLMVAMVALWPILMTRDATSPPAAKPAVQTSLWRGTDFAVTSNAAARDIVAAGNNGVIISFPADTDRSVINDVTTQVSGLGVLVHPPGRYRWTQEDGLRLLD
jgi:hypothetical protein